MGRRRGFLSLLVLIVWSAVAAGAAWVVCRLVWLPDPRDCDRTQLVQWLLMRDLERESFDLRLRLLRRLEQQTWSTIEPDKLKGWLTEQRRQRLGNNIAQLVEPWFVDKLENYLRLPPGKRTAYVDQILDRLAALSGLKSVGGSPASGQAGQPLVKTLMAQVPKWQQQAQPQRRREISEFLFALNTRWITRQLFGTLPRAG